jgi:hypothetical protein
LFVCLSYGRGRGAGGRELIRHGETGRDVVCACFRQDGLEMVVGLLDGSLHFWDPKETQHLGTIDGRQVCVLCLMFYL